MRRSLIGVALVCSLLCCALTGAQQPAAAKPPRLIVVLVIDQFRYDYLTRFRSEYSGGIGTFWNKGAVFTNAYLQHFPTVTAVGHSTILTGATPSLSGIVGNEWYDLDSSRRVTSVFDPVVRLLGAAKGDGASPARLQVSTVGDELKMAGRGPSKIIGISLKDRAAILTAGHMADGAFWFDPNNGNFISSTHYFPDLPAWTQQFNGKRSVDQWLGAQWKSADGKVLRTMPASPGPEYYDALERSPFGTELLLSFAQRAIEAEKLGSDDAPDILSISLSSTDHVGHEVGPDSPEIRELNLHTDRAVGQFLRYLSKLLPSGSLVTVLTADHGVTPLPEVQAERKMPGGRVSESALRKTVEAALNSRFGEARWLAYAASGSFWLNRATIAGKRLAQADVEDCAAQALAGVPRVARVYTATQLSEGRLVQDPVGLRVAHSFYRGRSADVIVILEPYWIYGAKDASHGSAYGYDSHLPLIFMGAGIKPGYYHQNVAINDIAPTLAAILEVETPSGSTGRVLHEILMR
ncbi:MAG TPA: alkaline phosphatase family protein [Bryobacteraceae bacterium]|nr:alkaline phosphatase family protein [Bryobacteraceae bacterium]